MPDSVIFEYCECHRQSYAVIGSQRCATSLDPAILYVGLDRIVEGIAHAHTYHVHVVQQHNGLMLLISFTGWLAYDHAVLFVAFIRQIQSFCKLAQVVGHSFLMM